MGQEGHDGLGIAEGIAGAAMVAQGLVAPFTSAAPVPDPSLPALQEQANVQQLSPDDTSAAPWFHDLAQERREGLEGQFADFQQLRNERGVEEAFEQAPEAPEYADHADPPDGASEFWAADGPPPDGGPAGDAGGGMW